jgi:hypothetical protein
MDSNALRKLIRQFLIVVIVVIAVIVVIGVMF